MATSWKTYTVVGKKPWRIVEHDEESGEEREVASCGRAADAYDVALVLAFANGKKRHLEAEGRRRRAASDARKVMTPELVAAARAIVEASGGGR